MSKVKQNASTNKTVVSIVESGKKWKSICLYLIPLLSLPIFFSKFFSPLSCLPCSEEDGEQEDKTIWYYSTKVNGTFFSKWGCVVSDLIIMFFFVALFFFLLCYKICMLTI